MEKQSPGIRNMHQEYWSALFAGLVSWFKLHWVWSGGMFILALFIILWWAGIAKFEGKFSPLGVEFSIPYLTETNEEEVLPLTQSVFSIASRALDLPSRERIGYVDDFYGLTTIEETGEVLDIGLDNSLWIGGESGGSILCSFSGLWNQRVNAVNRGEKVKFTGIVSSYDFGNGWVKLKNCKLLPTN